MAFWNCSSLVSLTIPSVTSIGNVRALAAPVETHARPEEHEHPEAKDEAVVRLRRPVRACHLSLVSGDRGVLGPRGCGLAIMACAPLLTKHDVR